MTPHRSDRPPSPPRSGARIIAVGVDWGTTHRRGYALGPDGKTVAEHADGDGMLAARGRFAASLSGLLHTLGADDEPVPVVLSGMVGSAHGWVEAPYLPAPLDLRSLPQHLFELPSAMARDLDPAGPPGRRRIRIVPGCVLRLPQRVDVMRGEETQLLGALALGHAEGWFLLPGTHSKWVRMRAGVVTDFATYLTGELFALLCQQGTLAAAVGSEPTPHHADAFLQGLRAAASTALSNALFGCRARVVSGAMPTPQARSYLSGLLIGAEWHDVRRRSRGRMPKTVCVIAAPELATLHTEAARALGVTLELIDPHDAMRAALGVLLGSSSSG